MAKFKTVQQGFLLKSAVRFWANIVRNYEKEISREEFFDLLHYCMDRNDVVKAVKTFFPKAALKKLTEEHAYARIDLVADSTDQILRKLWNAEGLRKKARLFCLKLCDELLNRYAEVGNLSSDGLEDRYNKLVEFLSLSDLEAEILLLGYVQYATVFKDFPEHVCREESAKFIAMAVDRSHHEVVRVLGKDGRLQKYGCFSEYVEFNATELAGYLSGADGRDLAEHFYHKVSSPTLPWSFFGRLAENEGVTLKTMLKASVSKRLNVLLYGVAGTGKTSFAKSLLADLGLDAYEVSLFDAADGHFKSVESRLAGVRICNDTVAGTRGVVIVDEADALLRTNAIGILPFLNDSRLSSEKGVVNSVLDEATTPIIWICNISSHEMDESVRRRFDFSIAFRALTRTQREMIWSNNVERLGLGHLVDENLQKRFAAKYETSAGGITVALENLQRISPAAQDAERLLEKFLKPHCELMCNRLDDGRSEPARDYSLDGMNVKGDIPLDDIVKAARNYLETNEHGPDSPRMNILLWGPPGTGKSEFVKFLAREMGRKYVAKMGGDLLSMWVGGTEENIKAAFEEAEYDNTILFFDEIDGLLRDRVSADHSWEITQVNELLYRMENFKGIFIGATNRNDSLDPAVLRRFTFKIEFDVLDATGKRKFFERTFDTVLTNEECARLEEIDNLTPGDFRTVRQRLFYLGNEVDNQKRLLSLEQECANKRNFHRAKIGF